MSQKYQSTKTQKNIENKNKELPRRKQTGYQKKYNFLFAPRGGE